MNTTTTNTVTVSDRFTLVVEHTPREQTDDWIDVATVTLTDWDAGRAGLHWACPTGMVDHEPHTFHNGNHPTAANCGGWGSGDRVTIRTFRGVAATAEAEDYVTQHAQAIRSGLLDGDELMSRETYTYTDKQGETFTGTLEDIGEWLIDAYTPEIACMDNPEPWHTLDDFGTTYPRRFTLDEWIDWTATCEDRTRREVENALTEVA